VAEREAKCKGAVNHEGSEGSQPLALADADLAHWSRSSCEGLTPTVEVVASSE